MGSRYTWMHTWMHTWMYRRVIRGMCIFDRLEDTLAHLNTNATAMWCMVFTFSTNVHVFDLKVLSLLLTIWCILCMTK